MLLVTNSNYLPGSDGCYIIGMGPWAVEESRPCTRFTVLGGTDHFCNQSHRSVWSLPQSLILTAPVGWFWLAHFCRYNVMCAIGTGSLVCSIGLG